MSYYKILGLEREPFSTSPDPDFFYLSKEHEAALNNTLIELRLKRGLSVILGDIGTGKTSLSRKLIQELRNRDDFLFYMILDPSFEDERSLYVSLLRGLGLATQDTLGLSTLQLKEALESFFFQKALRENTTIALIIDEAQKLNQMSLECLRTLLNYETNEFKLLQLILLGQLELHAKILNMPNFFDRISFKYTLNPLTYDEAREMVVFRLRKAGFKSSVPIFLDDAVREISQYSKGYPRRITMLCHKLLKDLVMRKKLVVDRYMVQEAIESEVNGGWMRQSPLPQRSSF